MARRAPSPTTRTISWFASYGRILSRGADSAGLRPRESCTPAPDGVPRGLRERFTKVIEDATGRPGIGCMSGKRQERDLMNAVLILGPTNLIDEHEIPSRGPSSSGS